MSFAASNGGDYGGVAETPAHPKCGRFDRVCVRVEGPFKNAPLNSDEMIPVIHYHVVPLASSLDAPTDRSTSSSGEDRWEQIK